MTGENKYVVYMHEFPNSKVYIGITCQDPQQRWKLGRGYLSRNKDGSYKQPLMANAILKYDWNDIKHQVIFQGLTKKEAEQKEIELIKYYQSNNRKFGYNIENGGNSNGKHTEETKKKISSANRGRVRSEEARQKMSVAKTGKKRPSFSTETRQKLGLVNKGRKRTEETKKKISDAKKGKPTHEIPVVCLETNVVYRSAVAAEKVTGAHRSKICEVCKGTRKTAGGFHWAYYQNVDNMQNCVA